MHDSRLATVFTQKLLAPSAVFAVLDNICAVTFWTMKDDRFYDHAPFIPSFRKNHYPLFFPDSQIWIEAFPGKYLYEFDEYLTYGEHRFGAEKRIKNIVVNSLGKIEP